MMRMKTYSLSCIFLVLSFVLVSGITVADGIEKTVDAESENQEMIMPVEEEEKSEEIPEEEPGQKVLDASEHMNAEEENSVAVVETLNQFTAAVLDLNVETILLDADIILTGVITIPANKPSLLIDGQGIYTLEQSRSTGTTTLASNSTQNPTYRLQNLTFIGRCYYGVINCNPAYNINLEIHNVTYTGPQVVYNRSGSVRFSGTNTITIQANAPNTNAAEEVAEVNQVYIEGDFNLITYTTGSSAFFWFINPNPIFRIEDDASVSIKTSTKRSANGLFFADAALDVSIGKRASFDLDITGYHPLLSGNTQSFKSMTIEEDAQVSMSCAGGLLLSGPFIVKENATFIYNHAAPPSGLPNVTIPMFLLATRYSDGSIISFNNPNLVVLSVEPTARPMFNFYNVVNTIDITTSELNYWSSYQDAHDKQLPERMWWTENDSLFNATTTNGLNWTIKDDSITLSNSLYLRSLQFGKDPFPLHPDEAWDYLEHITGYTEPHANVYLSYIDTFGQTRQHEGAADSNGKFTIACEPSSFDTSQHIEIISVIECIATRTSIPVYESGYPTADPVKQVLNKEDPFTTDGLSLLTNIDAKSPGVVNASIISLPDLEQIGLSSAVVRITNAAKKSSDITVPVFVIDNYTSIDSPPTTALRAVDFLIDMNDFPEQTVDIDEYIKEHGSAQAWNIDDGSELPLDTIIVAETDLRKEVGVHYAKLQVSGSSVERTITITVYNASEWINVRIPTKMLFGTLDPYYHDSIVSPRYEIENKSDRELQVVMGGFVINNEDNVSLLESGTGTGDTPELKLDLEVDQISTIENLYPFLGTPHDRKEIAVLESGQTTSLSFTGSYFGEYPINYVFHPRYSIVWAFEVLEGNDE